MSQKTIKDVRKFAPTEGLIEAIDDNFDEVYAFTGSNVIGTDVQAYSAETVLCHRQRVVIADINSGKSLLAAITGKSYRLVSCKAIAYGGAAGTVTTVDLLATQAAGSVKLVAFAQASLTQSAVLTDGGAGAAVLADGASYVANDAATAITVGKTGGAIDTATGIDFIIEYVIE